MSGGIGRWSGAGIWGICGRKVGDLLVSFGFLRFSFGGSANVFSNLVGSNAQTLFRIEKTESTGELTVEPRITRMETDKNSCTIYFIDLPLISFSIGL